jgi:D-alanyl-D-alanine carboxypeptidase
MLRPPSISRFMLHFRQLIQANSRSSLPAADRENIPYDVFILLTKRISMLRRSAIALAALLLLQAPVVSVHATPTQTQQDGLATSLDALLAPQFKADAPGITVIATRDGETVFRKAYGMADLGGKLALAPDAVLRLGSITKQFTAVGILMLAEEGKLSLSDDISRFLPNFPAQGRKVTIEHLLTHTSGIASYTGMKAFREVMTKDVSVEQGIDFFKNEAPEFEPGSKYRYNNSGYFLLGAIIEKVSGMPYARFVEERMFKPLGMTHSGYEGADGRLKPVSGYGQRDGSPHASAPLSMTWPYAAGALVSSVDDMARWQAGLVAGKLVRPESLQRAFTAYRLNDGTTTDYGYGWAVGKLNGSTVIHHGGDINGFSSTALWLPNEHIYVVLLGNSDARGSGALDKLARQLAMKIAGKPLPIASQAKLDTSTLAGYVGVYPIDEKASHMVRKENGGLSIQGTGMQRAALLPYKTDGFLIGDTLMTADFIRDDKGVVKSMTITDDKGARVHQRTAVVVTERPTLQLAPAVLDMYLGRYALAPGFVMEVTRQGEKLRAGPVGQPTVEMAALANDVFHIAENDAEMRFEKDPDGSMKLVLTQGPHKMSGKREL